MEGLSVAVAPDLWAGEPVPADLAEAIRAQLREGLDPPVRRRGAAADTGAASPRRRTPRSRGAGVRGDQAARPVRQYAFRRS